MYSRTISSLLSLLFTLTIVGKTYLEFPAGFKKGCGFSSYQNGGPMPGRKGSKSNWETFEEKHIIFNFKTINGPAIKNGERVGSSAGFWTTAFDDIKLLKELGCNTVRFSIEWADIEPIEGTWNEHALTFYQTYIDELIRQGIEPMITIYHWVHPAWFDKKGEWTKQENISYFKRYAQKLFERYGTKVKLWCTINEPTVTAACGHILGIHPPGNLFKIQEAGQVLHNLLNAHIAAYHALKAMPGGKDAQIGIVHQLLLFEPYEYQLNVLFKTCNISDPIGMLGSKAFNFTFAHKTTKDFLKTGLFYYNVPFFGNYQIPFVGKTNQRSYNARAKDAYDFIGLNFYSKVILGPHPTCYSHQKMTDMDYPMRPDLLYDAIKEMSELGKPIYITEAGIADKADTMRPIFIKECLDTLHRALKDGYDVRGFYYWTLMDNFEWNDGFGMKFGLYHTNYKTKKRTLRRGGQVYRDYFVVKQ